MEYHPKHPQPFSFSEALKFDVATITEEITRLQNSLRHLKRTQDELRAYSDGPELAEVLRENEAVIASQEERVYMLNMALIEKGVVTSSTHYELTKQPPAVATADEQQEVATPPRRMVVDDLGGENDDGGIVL
ncbi:hypothetical protein BJY52DRAFT_1234817 [Lactarius psammicola]|nr:hypothetical protein BJY52DRAFT_1234817 [Lactarius psammicola]